MDMDNSNFMVITVIIYGIVETLEKFGMAQKYAHLLAIPLGILGSFWGLPYTSPINTIVYGTFMGFSAVGICNTRCNGVNVLKKKNEL